MTGGHADVRKLTMPYYGGGVYPPIHLGREGARIVSHARTVSSCEPNLFQRSSLTIRPHPAGELRHYKLDIVGVLE